MATIRKRSWGDGKVAWICTYADQAGTRRQKTFKTRKAADEWMVQARGEVARGNHIPDHTAPTVADVAGRWLASAEANGLERSTLDSYKQDLAKILPALGAIKLSRLGKADVAEFRDALLRTKSRALTSKIMVSLRSILRYGDRPIDVRLPKAKNRHKKRLEAGRDFPTPAEVNAILRGSEGAARAVLTLAALAGLRASEIRGLRWVDLDLKGGNVTVEQRADRWNVISSPKSVDSRRTVPLGPEAVRILKEWRLACPPGHDLVLATKKGTPHLLRNLQLRIVYPAQQAAGVGPYGLHSFRHFYASWQLAQGITLKVLQERMGHSTFLLTADRYGHLMPETAEDRARTNAAERALLA